MEQLWKIVTSIQRAASKAEVRVVTGDTKVVQRGQGGGLFLATTGIGVREPGIALGLDRVRPGDRILVTGQLGISALERARGRIRRIPRPRVAEGRALARLASVTAVRGCTHICSHWDMG